MELQREGKFQDYLGISFSKLLDGSVHITQSGLIKKIIKATGMENCNPNKTPAQKVPLGKNEEDVPMTEEFHYRSFAGMMLYLSGNTCPDITFTVSQVAHFTQIPESHTQQH